MGHKVRYKRVDVARYATSTFVGLFRGTTPPPCPSLWAWVVGRHAPTCCIAAGIFVFFSCCCPSSKLTSNSGQKIRGVYWALCYLNTNNNTWQVVGNGTRPGQSRQQCKQLIMSGVLTVVLWDTLWCYFGRGSIKACLTCRWLSGLFFYVPDGHRQQKNYE